MREKVEKDVFKSYVCDWGRVGVLGKEGGGVRGRVVKRGEWQGGRVEDVEGSGMSA